MMAAGDRARSRQSADSDGVRVSFRPDAICIQFHRPPVNAFTVDMLSKLTTAIIDVRADPRPVLLTGSTRAFSAGFDTRQPASDPAEVNGLAGDCIAALQQHPGLTIAAVEGAAVGLGLLVATSADLLVVSATARLRMPEVALGMTSDPRPLRRFLPDPWIRRLCLLGETVTAEQVHFDSAGASLCEPGTCQDRAEDIIATIGSLPVSTLRETKQRLYE